MVPMESLLWQSDAARAPCEWNERGGSSRKTKISQPTPQRIDKVQSQRVERKKNNAEEIPTGNCANDVTLSAEKRSHSSEQNECGFKLDHLPRRDRHVDFFAHANGFALQQGKNKLHKHKNINLHNVSTPNKIRVSSYRHVKPHKALKVVFFSTLTISFVLHSLP